jgi:hypothetical protein
VLHADEGELAVIDLSFKMQNQAIQVKLVVTLGQIEDVVVSQLFGAHITLGGRRLLNRLCLF